MRKKQPTLKLVSKLWILFQLSKKLTSVTVQFLQFQIGGDEDTSLHFRIRLLKDRWKQIQQENKRSQEKSIFFTNDPCKIPFWRKFIWWFNGSKVLAWKSDRFSTQSFRCCWYVGNTAQKLYHAASIYDESRRKLQTKQRYILPQKLTKHRKYLRTKGVHIHKNNWIHSISAQTKFIVMDHNA